MQRAALASANLSPTSLRQLCFLRLPRELSRHGPATVHGLGPQNDGVSMCSQSAAPGPSTRAPRSRPCRTFRPPMLRHAFWRILINFQPAEHGPASIHSLQQELIPSRSPDMARGRPRATLHRTQPSSTQRQSAHVRMPPITCRQWSTSIGGNILHGIVCNLQHAKDIARICAHLDLMMALPPNPTTGAATAHEMTRLKISKQLRRLGDRP